MNVGIGHRVRRRTRKGQVPAQHAVEDHPQRVDIGAAVNFGPRGLFGRHVFGRADHHACAREHGPFGGAHESKIHQRRVPVGRQHDVGRLDVAVNHAAAVSKIKRAGDLTQNLHRLRQRHGAVILEPLIEGLAFQEFHDDVVIPIVFAHVVNRDHIAMMQLGRHNRLAVEAADEIIIEGKLRRQHFDGNDTLQQGIEALKDHAHAAAANFTANFIAAKPLSHQR